ncbi:transporter substrate-binding domain-containing protein [Mesorhizobium sp. B2-4-6]|uniref:substrate-binding periplasmic protein n=1 Tax=Mesorhizobium sp. B2-4-6 TaxID=2589943 RepID=UPI0015E2944C|nr:transporter substrate-binding domain-containing protein [Mesorhizobium sp. B2-4-6]
MKPLKALKGLAFVAALSVTSASPGFAQEPIKIGIDASYRPFAYVDEQGNLAGFEVELAKTVCEEIKATCDITNVPWDGIFAALEAGKIDMVGTTVTKSSERLAKYDASMTIMRVGYGFIVPASADISGGYEALKGQAVGTITGTEPYYKFIRGMIGENADIRGYQSPDAAVLDLDSGRIAAFMSDSFQLQGQFIGTGKYKYVAEPSFDAKWTGAGRSWIFRKGSSELIAKIDTGLKGVMSKPVFDDLAMKYFGMRLKTE